MPTRIKLTGLKSRSEEEEQHKMKLKHSTENEHWYKDTSTSTRHRDLLKEESEDLQHKADVENTEKSHPIHLSDVKNFSLLTHLLQQI